MPGHLRLYLTTSPGGTGAAGTSSAGVMSVNSREWKGSGPADVNKVLDLSVMMTDICTKDAACP